MSLYGEAIRERREFVGYATATAAAAESLRLERENPIAFRKFSQSTMSRWENDKTGEAIDSAHGRSLRSLAYLLKWTSAEFFQHVNVPIGRVPYLDESIGERNTSFFERFVERADLSVRIPVYGTVAAGIKGSNGDEEPEGYRLLSPGELPAGVQSLDRLYIVEANGSSMYAEGMARPVPYGASLIVEAGAAPAEKQLVVAYIDDLDLAVAKEYTTDVENVLLRSFRRGGPTFWSHDHEIHLKGVVRRVSYEPT